MVDWDWVIMHSILLKSVQNDKRDLKKMALFESFGASILFQGWIFISQMPTADPKKTGPTVPALKVQWYECSYWSTSGRVFGIQQNLIEIHTHSSKKKIME